MFIHDTCSIIHVMGLGSLKKGISTLLLKCGSRKNHFLTKYNCDYMCLYPYTFIYAALLFQTRNDMSVNIAGTDSVNSDT